VRRAGGRLRAVGGVRDVGLELRAGVLVVLRLGLLDILREAAPRAVAVGDGRVEVVEGAEAVAAVPGAFVVVVVLVRGRGLPQRGLVRGGQEAVDRVHR